MNDPIIITYTDLKKAFFRHIFALKIIASLSFFCTFVFLSTKEPQFLAETTFQRFGRIAEWYNKLPEMYRGFLNYPMGNNAILMMESKEVLKPIIEDLGLQMVMQEKLWSKWLENVRKNLLSTCNHPFKKPKNFSFSCVNYEKQVEIPILLQITSANTYQVLSNEKTLLAEGQINELVSTPLFSMRVDQFPEQYQMNVPYDFILMPWKKVVDQVSSKLDIRPSKPKGNFLKIYFSDPDNELSTKVVTHVIQFYENFIHSEMKQLLKFHKKYFRKKEEELLERFDAAFRDYAASKKGLDQEWVLDLRKELGIRLLQNVAQVAEMQEINLNLYNVPSKDQSIVSLHPPNHHLLGYSLLASFIGLLVGYVYFVSKMIIRGIPVSYEGLMAAGIHSCGYLSPCCGSLPAQLPSSDLKTLRQVCEFVRSHKTPDQPLVAALIIAQCANYVPSLVNLLVLRGFKILLIDCSFDQQVSDHFPTFIQYLEGGITQLPIRHLGEWDQLSMGQTKYGYEWLAHPKFSSVLLECRQYDLILLITNVSAKEVETQIFCKIADCVVVTAQTDSKQDLLPYLMLPKKQEISSATFVIIEENF